MQVRPDYSVESWRFEVGDWREVVVRVEFAVRGSDGVGVEIHLCSYDSLLLTLQAYIPRAISLVSTPNGLYYSSQNEVDFVLIQNARIVRCNDGTRSGLYRHTIKLNTSSNKHPSLPATLYVTPATGATCSNLGHSTNHKLST